MKRLFVLALAWCAAVSVCSVSRAEAFSQEPPVGGATSLSPQTSDGGDKNVAAPKDFDLRPARQGRAARFAPEQEAAAARLQARVPGARADADELLGSPQWIASPCGFLTAPGPDAVRTVPAFVSEHRKLFGHGPEVLDAAVKTCEFTDPHNGLHTTVWEQQLDEIPVFDSVFITHVTARGELVNVSSRFLPAPAQAADAGHAKRKDFQKKPPISARAALAKAIESIGEEAPPDTITTMETDLSAPRQPHRFKAGKLPGEARASLVWLPMERSRMRLCWAVDVTRRQRNESFRVLVDAETGEALVRRCLTFDLSDATYRVYTGDSPSPFSPAFSFPNTNQPPVVPRSLVTLSALDTNASPIGWINDGDNETRGNNVDAHLDRNGDDVADLPRPHGSPFRVFDFPLDLTQSPTAYSDAAVVQLFYWCNWMHDQLYNLGFTEAAGNFQKDNFGRGGAGNDALQADAQDGSGFNNANFTFQPDGTAPRIQMYLFNGPTPNRDGDLDAEVICHEYTHGLSGRLVGGGVGIWQNQTYGLGEGWSDFYALALLSKPEDGLDGCYPVGGYASYLFSGLTENYYYGIRRYPVSTDLAKNPLTFKDIDPTQESSHAGVPRSPTSTGNGAEVHKQGEVWCAALWEVRASLIRKYGWTNGNARVLRLITDGMKLSPPNPNFVQARNAIQQADLLPPFNGADRGELSAAFAKRGLGNSATAPDSSTTIGVHEAFDVPDSLDISPTTPFISTGRRGGPFGPASVTYTLNNIGASPINWLAAEVPFWITLSASSGVLAAGTSNAVVATVNASAASLLAGSFTNYLLFTNQTSGQTIGIQMRLVVVEIPNLTVDFVTEFFNGNGDFDLDYSTLTFRPDPLTNAYTVCRMPAIGFPTDPSGGQPFTLTDDCYGLALLTNGAEVSIYGRRTNAVLIGSNGDVIFDLPTERGYALDPATGVYPGPYYLPDDYFQRPRVAPLFVDLNPATGGTISWKQLPDRLAVTWQSVPEYGRVNANSFQLEWFFDGTIRFTYFGVPYDVGANYSSPRVGLAQGIGTPANFVESDFSASKSCLPPMTLVLPTKGTEGSGPSGAALDSLLPWRGTIILSQPAQTDLPVTFAFSDTNAFVVPSIVIITNGQTTANFSLYIPNDHKLTGPRAFVATARATGFSDATAAIEVNDADVASLTVTLPARATEAQGVMTGHVSISATPDAAITVQLSSSDLALVSLPPTVEISKGQTSAAFNFWVSDDLNLSGPTWVLVSASVPNPGWQDDWDVIVVADNESTNLVLTLPVQAHENAGVATNAGVLYLGGYVATNVVASLTSDNTNAIQVPAQVTVPAGQLFASFDITVLDDNLLNGTRSVAVRASAPGFGRAAQVIAVLDDESPSYPTNPSPAHLATRVSTDVTLAWSVDPSIPASGLTFDVYLSTNVMPGAADLLGHTTNTTWPLQGLAQHTAYFWRVVARAQAVEMPGPVWQFTTVGLDHFLLSTVASPRFIAAPFDLTVTAIDEAGATATAFNGPLNLAAMMPVETSSSVVIAEVDTGVSDRVEFANVSRKEVNLSGWQVVLYDWSAWPTPKITFTIPNGSFCAAGELFLLRKSTAQNAPGTYPSFAFADTLNWNNSASGNQVAVLLLDAATNLVDFVCAVDADPAQIVQPSAIPASQWSGPPLSANPTANWTYQRIGKTDHNMADDWTIATNNIAKTNDGLTLPFAEAALLAVTPTLLSNFTAGVWTGSVTLHDTATNVFLRVEDGFGRQSTGNVFAVTASNNLALTTSLSPGRKTLGNPFTYYLTVANTGPLPATGVQVIDDLPVGATLISATSSVGTVTQTAGQLLCDLGTLDGDASATVGITVLPDTEGILTNRAAVSRLEPEAYTADDLSVLATAISSPVLYITDAGVREGNTGTTNVLFTLRLSDPSQRKVKVFYATSDGSATAGSDYTSTAGAVAFLPGVTNLTLSVTTFGDTLYESNETFFVNFTNPVNALLSRERAIGTITNDDASPGVSISDATVVEGDGNTTTATFNVTLSSVSGVPASISYATSDGSATAGLDYLATSGRFTFPPGTTNLPVTVTVSGNMLYQLDRTFSVSLTVPTSCYLSRSQGTGTILDDDASRLHHFAWLPVTPTQYLHESFPVSLVAQDAVNRTITDFDGLVSIRASAATRTATNGTATNRWEFPLGAYYHDTRLQVIYPAAGVGAAGRITALSLDVALRPGQILSNWTIRLAHTALASFSAPNWETNWTVVYQADQTFAATGWVTFNFQAPFDYNGQDNLMADFSFNDASYSSDGYCRSTKTNVNRSLYFRTDSAFGDPLTWAGSADPAPILATQFPNVRFQLETPLSFTPTVLSNFVSGVWTGPLTALETNANVNLLALDAAGHTGASTPFLILVRDTDADGMPDEWELAHNLNPKDPADAALDPDSDGLTNLQEYWAGTDPQSAASQVRIVSVAATPEQFVAVSFRTVTNRHYQLEYCVDLTSGGWKAAAALRAGTGDDLTVLAAPPVSENARFFRVKVLP